MPELPDVEVYRRRLEGAALHRPVAGVHVATPDLLHGTTPQGLGRALNGRCFTAARRHGKYLFAVHDGDGALVLHFGMSGVLVTVSAGDETPDYTRCEMEFSDGGRLAYTAPRKLGLIALTGTMEGFIRDRGLGSDALGLDADALGRLASGRRGGIKAWLMDQETMAGIGNVYSDEILFQARMHPRRAVKALDEAGLDRLQKAMNKALHDAIEAGAEPGRMPAGFLLPHRHDGGHCPNCDTPVEHLQAAGRTAWLCPRCQRD